MAELALKRPGWLDWNWALSVLDQEVRQPGEDVRPADGVIATPYLQSDQPVVVTVRARGDHLVLTPSDGALAGQVARRFHLNLDERAVTAALGSAALPGLAEPGDWMRRPAAADLWSYCLTFLCGGDPDAGPVRQMFAELGKPAGPLRLAPDPAEVLAAGEHRLTACGAAPHRVANVLSLARAFVADPGRYDEASLRALPAGAAIGRVAELPHIGQARARMIASTALGHDDVLVDLSRRDDQLRRTLSMSWSQVLAASRRAAPYRSILGDTLLERLPD
jgi:hypothetical protein